MVELTATPDRLLAALLRVESLLDSLATENVASEFLSVKQVADRLGVCERTIRDLVRSGKLAASRIGKGRGTLRFDPAQLRHYQLESAGHFKPKRGRWPSA